MIYCPYCNDDREGIRFALTRDDLVLMFNEDELSAKKDSLIDPVLYGEDGTLKKYGIGAAADDCLRVLFRPGEIPDFIRDKVDIRPADRSSRESHVVVDGCTADIVSRGGKPTPVMTVACGNCHLILPNEYAEDGVSGHGKKSVNISLISNVGGSKTALAISLYYRFKEKGSTINMAEPFFNKYYKGLERMLARREAPGATHGSKTPCLTIKFRSTKGEVTEVHITDTAGEILGKDPDRKDITGEVRDFRPAVESDMLIVIVDSDDESRISLMRLESYLEELKSKLSSKRTPTKIIVCFSKCDRYPEHAREYMFVSYQEWKDNWKKKGIGYRNLMNLRKAKITDDSSYFMTGGFYTQETPRRAPVITSAEEAAETAVEEEAGFDIDIDIPVENTSPSEEIISEAVPATEEESLSACETPAAEHSPADTVDTEHFLKSLRVCCNEISDYSVQYVCAAPFGTEVSESRLTNKYSPLYIEDLIETIRIYGGIG